MYAGVCGARETPGQSIASANLSGTYLDERAKRQALLFRAGRVCCARR
jgi:hypothetical protein